VPLFYNSNSEKFVLYKDAGIKLSEMRIDEKLHPKKLYLKRTDKLAAIREVQSAFNKQLEKDIKQEAPDKVKQTILAIVEETYKEPRSGSIEGLLDTVDILVSDFAQESEIVKNLLFVSNHDYTTILHSINVMALVIGYATSENFPLAEKRILGLGALLHDVGKVKIDSEILCAPRNLTNNEFEEMKSHTISGYQILSHCKFRNPDIKLCALQHHEKIDGSGYPSGISHISKAAQIVGLVDCYEALTNDDRPYRSAMDPFRTLTIIKNDVMAGKYDRKLFEKFCYSFI
jgi:HD-GYP domain-containing protein (c-di-GMP phosphodiesterase class II)